jgi:putative membrane protein
MQRRAIISRALFILLILPLSLITSAKDVPSTQRFLGKAIQDGRAEINICKLALQRSGNPAVKEFAQRMIDDHMMIDAKIKVVARSRKIRLPQGITLKQKATYELLKHNSGDEFDRKFAQHNVADHDDDIRDFVKQANGAADMSVKTFAADTLTVLKEHLQRSKDLLSAVDK